MKEYHINSESHEQITLMQWATLNRHKYPQLDNMFHIANGSWRHPSTAARLKAEGVKPGVPDLMLAYPSNGYAGLFIEMKKRVGGRVQEKQTEWHERLSAAGYAVRVCKGWEEAKNEIELYLKPQPVEIS